MLAGPNMPAGPNMAHGPNIPEGPNALASRRTLEAAQEATDEGQTAASPQQAADEGQTSLEGISCGSGWNYAHDSSSPNFVGI